MFRCGNVASILELDEWLGQEYKVFTHAPTVSSRDPPLSGTLQWLLLIPVLNLNDNSFRTSAQFLLNDHLLIISCKLCNVASIAAFPGLLLSPILSVHVYSHVKSPHWENCSTGLFCFHAISLSYLMHPNMDCGYCGRLRSWKDTFCGNP